MTSLVDYVVEGVRYRGGGGQWTWVLHRLAGLGTLLFLSIHVADTATVYFAPNEYAFFMNLYRSPVFGVAEMVLVACVLYHALNGLRIALFDLFPRFWTVEMQRRAVWYVAIAFCVLYVPAFIIMGGTLLAHLGG